MYGQAFMGAFVLVLIGIGIAVPILVILNAWIVEQTMSGATALAGMAVLLICLFALWAAQGSAWMFFWIAVVIAACAGMPLLTAQSDKRAIREMANDNIPRYLDAIERDPRNAAAHAYLADAYVECGRLDEAIAAYQKAIELDPTHSQPERSKLQRAVEAQKGLARASIRVCDQCGKETPAGRRSCAHCGAPLQMSFFVWLAQPESIRAVTRQSVIVILVLTILLAILSSLPLEVKGCVIIAAIFVGAFYLLRRVGGEA